jgi:hypothetical protein
MRLTHLGKRTPLRQGESRDYPLPCASNRIRTYDSSATLGAPTHQLQSLDPDGGLWKGLSGWGGLGTICGVPRVLARIAPVPAPKSRMLAQSGATPENVCGLPKEAL